MYFWFDVEFVLVVDVIGFMSGDMGILCIVFEGIVDILFLVGSSVDDLKVKILLIFYSVGVNV